MNNVIKTSIIFSIFAVLAPFRFTDAYIPQPNEYPRVEKFSASINPVPVGQTTTLAWSAPSAVECILSGGEFPGTRFQPNYSIGANPRNAETRYSITCWNNVLGYSEDSKSIVVYVGTAAPAPTPTPTPFPTQQPVNAGSVLSANTNNILPGQSVLLSWYSNNADWCTASNGWSGPRPLSGSQTVNPYFTTTYTITCSNATGGTAWDSETIYVNQPQPTPYPTPYPTPPPQGLGAACDISPSIPRIGNTVTFTAVEAGGTFPYFYSWNGDASGQSKTVSRTFTTAGIKFATVRITDAFGRVSNGSCSVEVLPPAPVPTPRPTATPGQVQGAATTCKTVNVPVTVCVDSNGKTVETTPTPTASVTPTDIIPTPTAKPTVLGKNSTTTKSFLASIFSVSDDTWARVKSLLKWYLAILAIILFVAIAYFIIKRVTGKDVK